MGKISSAKFHEGPRTLETPTATLCCGQSVNQSVITNLSITYWHKLSGITHLSQQRVDSEQERFPNMAAYK